MHVLKYILFEDGVALVFPTDLRHIDAASAHATASAPFRAGFVTLDGPGGKVHTFGDSESLGLSSSPNDADLIAEQYLSKGV